MVLIRKIDKGDEASRPRDDSEHREQAALFEWLDGEHPELGAFSIPNGGARAISVAKAMKKEGLKPGVPDLFVPVARPPYHGLFIEMKKRKGGRVSKEQEARIDALRAAGYAVKVCRGFDAAKRDILDYIGPAKEDEVFDAE